MSGNSDKNINENIDDIKRAYDGQQNETPFVENTLDAEKTKTAYKGYGFSEVCIIFTNLLLMKIGLIGMLHKLSQL